MTYDTYFVAWSAAPSCQIDLVLDSPGNCDVQHLHQRMVFRERRKQKQIPEPCFPCRDSVNETLSCFVECQLWKTALTYDSLKSGNVASYMTIPG